MCWKVDRDVLAGLRVPLVGTVGAEVAASTWIQLTGPAVNIEAPEALSTAITIPAVTAAGTAFAFRLAVTFLDGHALADDVVISVHDPVFETFIAGTTSNTTELGPSEGLAFNAAGLWVVTSQASGWVSLFSNAGTFVRKQALTGFPVGANFMPDGSMVIANRLVQAGTGTTRLDRFDTNTNMVTTLASALDGTGVLGSVNYPLPDRNGNIYVSTYTSNKVVKYTAATGKVTSWLTTLASNSQPNALAFGPEPDRIYVGANTKVYRVQIASNGSVGVVDSYVTGLQTFDTGGGNAMDCDVDGLTFDEGNNLYIGCVNAVGRVLYIAPYAATGTATVTRTFRTVPTVAGFVNPTFGSAAFGRNKLYWSTLDFRHIGRLDVGLGPLTPPLAVQP